MPAQKAYPLRSKADWRTIVEELVDNASGFDATAANKVVSAYLRKIRPPYAKTPTGRAAQQEARERKTYQGG